MKDEQFTVIMFCLCAILFMGLVLLGQTCLEADRTASDFDRVMSRLLFIIEYIGERCRP